MRIATLIVSLALFALAVGYWFAADTIPASRLAGQVGADGLPKLLGVALGSLSLLLALQTIIEMRRGENKRVVRSTPNEEVESSMRWSEHLNAFGLLGIGVGYLLILPYLGYMVSATLLLATVATYSGLKPSLSTVLFAIGGGISFYVIFVKVLQIPLPAGFWQGLL